MQFTECDLSRFERLGQYVRQKGKIVPLDQQVLDEFSAAIDEAINYSKRRTSSPTSRGHLRIVHSSPRS
jgi:hypothetical protein